MAKNKKVYTTTGWRPDVSVNSVGGLGEPMYDINDWSANIIPGSKVGKDTTPLHTEDSTEILGNEKNPITGNTFAEDGRIPVKHLEDLYKGDR